MVIEISVLVSIVIPTFNRASDLKRALTSLISQTYPNWEAIVVDNYSSDNSTDVVNSFNDNRIKYFKKNNNGLIAISRNFGISKSKGDYIAFLDSDDWWTFDKLAISLRYLQHADFVYHDMYMICSKNRILFSPKVSKTRVLEKPVFNNLINEGNAINNSSVVIRKSILPYDFLLPVDNDLNPICDYHAWICISLFTDKFMKIPKSLGYLWVGGGNFTNPLRTLSSLNRFVFIYQKYFIYSNEHPQWITYLKGKSYYEIGQFNDAFHEFSSIKFKKNFVLFFKSKIYKCLSLLKI